MNRYKRFANKSPAEIVGWHPDVDLPIFGNTRIVANRIELKAMSRRRVGEMFVRSLIFSIGTRDKMPELEECLAITNRELAAVGKACGAEVVEHQWGLVDAGEVSQCPNSLASSLRSQRFIVPSGYLAVAQVAVVERAEVPPELLPAITTAQQQGIHAYRTGRVSPDGYTQTDVRPAQMMFGRPDTGEPRLMYVDIEPFIEKR